MKMRLWILFLSMAVAVTAIAVSPAAAASTTTFTPVADAYVQDTTPSTNYGIAVRLGVDASPPVLRTFLRFTVSGLTEAVTSARLRIHTARTVKASSDDGGTFAAVSDTFWSETAVTWNNQPAIDGATLGTLGSVSRDAWSEIDVSSFVSGNGTFSIGVTSTSSDDALYDSRETGATAPQLVVTTGVASTDPVLVGAGDIASCKSGGDEATANLLDGIPGTVFT